MHEWRPQAQSSGVGEEATLSAPTQPLMGDSLTPSDEKTLSLLTGGVAAAVSLVIALGSNESGAIARIARNHPTTTTVGFCSLAFLGGSLLLLTAVGLPNKRTNFRFWIMLTLFVVYGFAMASVTYSGIRISADTTAPAVELTMDESSALHVTVKAVDAPVGEPVWIQLTGWKRIGQNPNGTDVWDVEPLVSRAAGADRDGNVEFSFDYLPRKGVYSIFEANARIGLATGNLKNLCEPVTPEHPDVHFGCARILVAE